MKTIVTLQVVINDTIPPADIDEAVRERLAAFDYTIEDVEEWRIAAESRLNRRRLRFLKIPKVFNKTFPPRS